MHVVLLDNRDSFVWNLAQALGSLGAAVTVLRSDRCDVTAVRAASPDAIVVSPGPGRPEDAGSSVATIRALSGSVPILGVCLGHQAIGVAFGARVERSVPCHGKAWRVHHRGDGLFAGLPDPFVAARYHSLAVHAASLPAELVADAWTEEGVLMAMHHREHRTYGVQFHPESFRTALGTEVLRHFVEAAA